MKPDLELIEREDHRMGFQMPNADMLVIKH